MSLLSLSAVTPAMFQHFMNDILRENLDQTAVGILDDVIIFSEDPSLHVGHVRAILQILRDNKLYAKVEKCEFDKDIMTFVGYMVSKAGIGMDLQRSPLSSTGPFLNPSKMFNPS